ncbi:MAG: NusG domain II-containing protein, partial [Clostridia bacterium]|nr:NusG domain II-containing protein [Clostridia bacterium]
KLTKLDLFIIILAVLIAIALFIFKMIPSGSQTVLYVISDQGSQTYSLSEKDNITAELVSRGIAVKIRIEDGCAFIESSGCPNGICMKSPKAEKAGDSIVCAPAGLALIVKEAGGGADADALAG